jgi:hypothetical protein
MVNRFLDLSFLAQLAPVQFGAGQVEAKPGSDYTASDSLAQAG